MSELKEASDIDFSEYNFTPEVIEVNGKSVIDYTKVENDKVFLVNKKDILTKPRPSWIPEMDLDGLHSDQYLPVTVHDDKGNYFVQVKKLKENAEEIKQQNRHDPFFQKDRLYDRLYYKMNLNTLTATIDYYLKYKREELKAKNLNSKVSLPRGLHSISLSRYYDIVELLQFCDNYKNLDKKIFDTVLHRNSEAYRTQNQIIFKEQYIPLLESIKDKKIDLNYQKQDYIDAHAKGEDTSYSSQNAINNLYDKYGILIKKQNGKPLTSTEISKIDETVSNVWNHYGNLTNNAKDFELVVSYADNCNQHARKAVGLFTPSYNAIGVSFFKENKAERLIKPDCIFAHEVAHWVDSLKGKETHNWFASDKDGTLENKIAQNYKELVKKQNAAQKDGMGLTKKEKVNLGDYWYRTCECFARAMEQDYAIKHNIKIIEDGYLPEEIFKEKIQPLVQELLEENKKHFGLEFENNMPEAVNRINRPDSNRQLDENISSEENNNLNNSLVQDTSIEKENQMDTLDTSLNELENLANNNLNDFLSKDLIKILDRNEKLYAGSDKVSGITYKIELDNILKILITPEFRELNNDETLVLEYTKWTDGKESPSDYSIYIADKETKTQKLSNRFSSKHSLEDSSETLAFKYYLKNFVANYEKERTVNEKNIEQLKQEYIFHKFEKAGITVVKDKDKFNQILESETVLQKMAEENKIESLFETHNAENLESEIDKLSIDDIFLKDEFINISEKTPYILKELGLTENPINIYKQKLARAFFLEEEKFGERRTHGHKGEFTDKEVKEVFKNIGNPRYIFNSKLAIPNREDNYLIAVYDTFDKKDNPMMLSFHYNKNKKEIEANWVTAVYGKRKNVLVDDWTKKGYLVYINDQEIEKAPTEVVTLHMRVSKSASAYKTNIIHKSAIVNNLNILFFKQNNEVYGFTHNNKIYINPEIFTSEVAMHEYTHLWDNYTKNTNPELYKKGKEAFKKTNFWNEVLNDENYKDIIHNENLIFSEAHARLISKMVDDRLNDIILQDKENFSKDTIINWEKEVENYILKDFDVQNQFSKEEIDLWFTKPMKDFVDGINLNISIAQENKITQENIIMENENKKIVNSYEDLKEYRYFIRRPETEDIFSDSFQEEFEPIKNLNARQALEKLMELATQGKPAGIGIVDLTGDNDHSKAFDGWGISEVELNKDNQLKYTSYFEDKEHMEGEKYKYYRLALLDLELTMHEMGGEVRMQNEPYGITLIDHSRASLNQMLKEYYENAIGKEIIVKENNPEITVENSVEEWNLRQDLNMQKDYKFRFSTSKDKNTELLTAKELVEKIRWNEDLDAVISFVDKNNNSLPIIKFEDPEPEDVEEKSIIPVFAEEFRKTSVIGSHDVVDARLAEIAAYEVAFEADEGHIKIHNEPAAFFKKFTRKELNELLKDYYLGEKGQVKEQALSNDKQEEVQVEQSKSEIKDSIEPNNQITQNDNIETSISEPELPQTVTREIPQVLNYFHTAYDFLYENGLHARGSDYSAQVFNNRGIYDVIEIDSVAKKLVIIFDNEIKNNQKFKDFISLVVKQRGDFFSSDRETASLLLAIKEVGLEKELDLNIPELKPNKLKTLTQQRKEFSQKITELEEKFKNNPGAFNSRAELTSAKNGYNQNLGEIRIEEQRLQKINAKEEINTPKEVNQSASDNNSSSKENPFEIIFNKEKGRVNISLNLENSHYLSIAQELKENDWKYAPSKKLWYPLNLENSETFAKSLQEKYATEFLENSKENYLTNISEIEIIDVPNPYEGIKFFDRNFNEVEEFKNYFEKNTNKNISPLQAKNILEALNHLESGMPSDRTDRIGLDKDNNLIIMSKEKENLVFRKTNINGLIDHALNLSEQTLKKAEEIYKAYSPKTKSYENELKDLFSATFEECYKEAKRVNDSMKDIHKEFYEPQKVDFSVGSKIGNLEIKDIFNIAKDVYQVSLEDNSGKYPSRSNHFIIEENIKEKINPEIAKLFENKNGKYIVENKSFEPYVLNELIKNNLMPSRDNDFSQKLEAHIKENPLPIVLFTSSFEKSFEESLTKNQSLSLNERLNVSAMNTLNKMNLNKTDSEIINTYLKEKIGFKEPKDINKLALILPQKMQERFFQKDEKTLNKAKKKDNGYPPRGEN